MLFHYSTLFIHQAEYGFLSVHVLGCLFPMHTVLQTV